MGKFDGFLFITDCDGTLTDRKGEISEENIRAIHHFQEEGGRFTFGSGRFPQYVHRFDPYFRANAYPIMGNGTSLYDIENDRILREITLDPPPREALEFITGEGLCDFLFVDLRTHSRLWAREPDKIPWKGPEYTTNLEELFAPQDEPWHKVNFCFRDEETNRHVRDLMRQKFPEFQFVMSWGTGMELLPPRGGKGAALTALRELMGDRVKVVVAAGDCENDASMLQAADLSYAVANASEEAVRAANRRTVSCDESAIAAIISELEKEL